jgi:ubiquinone/menaquinone biosynthesis C-methylase UbiE
MLISDIHSKSVFPRRKQVLVNLISALIPEGSSVLDVGTGDGSIAAAIQQSKQGLVVTGIDVLVRNHTEIPVSNYDGLSIPFSNNSYDIVLFVDVLHHTDNPQRLLNEAARVAKKYVIIKDHNRNGFLAETTLRFMDWVGNAHYGVALPYNYWSQTQWLTSYQKAGLKVVSTATNLGLYPAWADWLFGRGLHSIVVLETDPAK